MKQISVTNAEMQNREPKGSPSVSPTQWKALRTRKREMRGQWPRVSYRYLLWECWNIHIVASRKCGTGGKGPVIFIPGTKRRNGRQKEGYRFGRKAQQAQCFTFVLVLGEEMVRHCILSQDIPAFAQNGSWLSPGFYPVHHKLLNYSGDLYAH